MIATIDRLRHNYTHAVEAAIDAHADLCRISDAYQSLEDVPTAAAIDEMDKTTNVLIDALARAEVTGRAQPTYIHVGGDWISVGSISDSESIAIGKRIEQDIAKGAAQ